MVVTDHVFVSEVREHNCDCEATNYHLSLIQLLVPLLQQEDRYTQQCEAEVPCLECGARLDRLWQRARHAQGII